LTVINQLSLKTQSLSHKPVIFKNIITDSHKTGYIGDLKITDDIITRGRKYIVINSNIYYNIVTEVAI